MKNNLSLQLAAGTDIMITELDPFPGIDLVNTITGYAGKLVPAKTSSGPVGPVKKVYSRETNLKPLYNIPLKKVAVRLSEIELALECYNASELKFSVMALKDLFQDMRMPAVCKLTAQMEDLAGENRFQEVKDLFREVKKIIGWILKQRKLPRD